MVGLILGLMLWASISVGASDAKGAIACPETVYYLVMDNQAWPFIPDAAMMADMHKAKLFDMCADDEKRPCVSEMYFFPDGNIRGQCVDPFP